MASKRQCLTSAAAPAGAGPVYREHGVTYRADTCRPLVAAAAGGQLRLAARSRGGYPGERLQGDELPGMRSVGMWDADHPQDWGLPLHRNEGIELTYLATGSLPVTIVDRAQTLQHGEFMITRPWQPHRLGDPHIGVGKLVWLILDVGVRRPHQEWRWPPWIVLSRADLAALTRCLRQNEQYIWPGSEALRRGFLGLADILVRGGPHVCSELAVTVNELLLHLLRVFRERNIPLRVALTSAERSVALFFDELREALGEPWTLPAMAESCGLGVTRFAYHCRTLHNLSPMQYLARLRVARAAVLLREEPRRSITDIALTCGFSSSQYFTNVFRNATDQAPRDYRRHGGC